MAFKAKRVDEEVPWQWASGHKLEDLIIDPRSDKHGNRPIGQGQDHTSIPIDQDLTNIMPLPWICPKCGNGHLMYVFNCNRCGCSSPIGDENWRA